MKWMRIVQKGLLSILAAAVITAAVPGQVPVLAEEVADTAEQESEAAESMTEEEIQAAAEEAQAALETVTPSEIPTNIEGKYLALSFPASEVPEGFTVYTIEYAGQTVSLAQMVSKSATLGAEGLTVTLAYLTDADGSNGEFYLCDTTNDASMSDMIKIDGKGGDFIIVLDPGDNVMGPNGFRKRELQWGNKRATAWSLPKETAGEEEETEEGVTNESASLFVTRVYAEELFGAGAGASNISVPSGETEGEDAAAEETGETAGAEETPAEDVEEPAAADGNENEGAAEAAGETAAETAPETGEEADAEAKDAAMLALEEIAHTNAAGLIQAQPDEFCLLYAIDESGNLGYYLYDIKEGTYQRYVEVPHGESATTAKYRKLSRNRLFIIVILAILLVILLFLLINMLLGRRKSGRREREDEYDEMEEMRRRVAKKERHRIMTGRRELDYHPDSYEEDEEEEEEYWEEEEDGSDDMEDEEDTEDDGYGYGEGYEDEDSYGDDAGYEEDGEYPGEEDEVPEEPYPAEDDVDWENMEVTAGLSPKKTGAALRGRKEERRAGKKAAPARKEKEEPRRRETRQKEKEPVRGRTEKRPARRDPGERTMPEPRKPRPQNYDLDDDFDFEFINVDKRQ